MNLPGTITIPNAKFTQYLLVPRREDDKSKFLAQAGLTADNPDQLKKAIQTLAQTYEAIADRKDKYGTFYRVEGPLTGPNETLAVVTV